MSNLKNVVLKVGSQSMVSSEGSLDLSQLEHIVSQIIFLKTQGFNIILVSSGAVATGRTSTKDLKLKFQNIVEERQTMASIGQAKLIEIYNTLLKKKGYIAAQILLTKEDFRLRSHYLNTYHLLNALSRNPSLLPIVNENDVTSINELMFTDNDELSALIAIQMHVSKLIILTSTDGVFTQNPEHQDAKLIEELDLKNKDVWPHTGDSKTYYGRGGMQNKLLAVKKAAHYGIQSHIANAKAPDIIKRICLNEKIGTVVLPFKQQKGIKRWLAHSHSAALPFITVNEGLCDCLIKKEKAISVLPVGIVSLHGEFEKGDLVSIKNQAGQTLGIGVAGYDNKTLTEVLGQKGQKAFIHYNKIRIFEN